MPAAISSDEEVLRLHLWRFSELERAGYPPNVASMLAGRGLVDLHAACDLLDKGCSVEKALAILL